jgi:hypothetical protein
LPFWNAAKNLLSINDFVKIICHCEGGTTAAIQKTDFVTNHFVLGQNRDPHASAPSGLAQDDKYYFFPDYTKSKAKSILFLNQ